MLTFILHFQNLYTIIYYKYLSYRNLCHNVCDYLGNLPSNIYCTENCSQRVIGAVNGFLVSSIIVSFTTLVVSATATKYALLLISMRKHFSICDVEFYMNVS